MRDPRRGSTTGDHRGRRLRRAGLATAALLAGTATAVAMAIAPPNDPDYGKQTAAGGALAIIKHPEALRTIGKTPLADVLVTALDTGLDLDHPEFAGRLATVPAGTPAPKVYGSPPTDPAVVPPGGSSGWDLIGTLEPGDSTLKPDADPTDPVGRTSHGTAVSGVLGAATGNGVGGAGVAPNARFLALRTCWDDDNCYQSIQADATTWAVDRGVRVVSMSWLSSPVGGDGRWGDGFDTVIKQSTNALFVAIPGGNGDGGKLADADRRPCGDPAANILCVTTSSPGDGLDCGEVNPAIVDLAVPTQNSVTAANGGGTQATGCATSYAAPVAAGAAAVLFGLDPKATPVDVKNALVDSARKVPAFAGKTVSGGVLDLDAAVKLFAQRRGITLVPDTGTGTTTTPTTTTTGTTTTGGTTTQPTTALPPLTPVSPRKLTATGTRKGFATFTLKGRLTLPPGASTARYCGAGGSVTVTARSGRRTLATRKAKLTKTCRYSLVVAFSRKTRIGGTSVRFSVRFGGSSAVRARAAQTVTLKLGRRT
ncbi:protease [Paraconexibacter sp. AEG42_29]|uniref:Protease n=1 Tax=Paraconexibacter sp. AEG42_29 TaxID=2997339 RepID=A0AAU7ANV9_9ACTN